MKTILRNIGAVVGGFIAGSAVNMGLILISGSIIAPPDGADVTTMEGLRESMHLFEPKHFLFPFLAHALGTFIGAYFTAKIAGSYRMLLALVIGFLFLAGGIVNVILLPSPIWFTVIDLVVAYLPMAYLAAVLAVRDRGR